MNIDAASCSIFQNCVGGTGVRQLLRFSSQVNNQGLADLVLPAPSAQPNLYDVNAICWQTPALRGFLSAALTDTSGNVVAVNRSSAACLRDTSRVSSGPSTGVRGGSSTAALQDFKPVGAGSCRTPPISQGNAGSCPFIDVTGIPSGNYFLRVTVNPNRVLNEVTFDNNTTAIPVTIP
jgi:hypothetical protein